MTAEELPHARNDTRCIDAEARKKTKREETVSPRTSVQSKLKKKTKTYVCALKSFIISKNAS